MFDPAPLTDTPPAQRPALPYYHVRRLITGTYAVAHMVPGTQTAHIDAEALSAPSAMRLCAEMEQARRAAQTQAGAQ